MAIFFNTGFEHQVVSASGAGLFGALTGTPTISTTTFRNGLAALRVNPAAAAMSVQPVGYSATTIACDRFGFRWATNTTPGTGDLGEWSSATASTWHEFGLDASNKLTYSILGSGGTTYFTSAAALTVNTWYVIERLINCSANPWTVRVIIRDNTGTLIEDSGTVTTLALAASNINVMRLGAENAATVDFFFDDWVCASGTAADFPLGNGKGVWIVPGSDGTHNTAGGATFINSDAGTTPNFTNSTTTAYTYVDDATWSTTRSTTDNISAETHVAGDYLEIVPAATPETGNANVVRALLSYSSVTATANAGSFTVVRNSGGTQNDIFGNPTTGADYSESTNFFKSAQVTNPGTWSPTEVNAVRWRIGRAADSSDVSPRPTWQALALEVDYPVALAAAGYAAVQPLMLGLRKFMPLIAPVFAFATPNVEFAPAAPSGPLPKLTVQLQAVNRSSVY